MNALENLAFDDHLVRVTMREGDPWFVGKDVCDVLSIKDYHQALEKLDNDERGMSSIPTPRGVQDMIVISEPGVYRMTFRSRKPEAERFKRWIAHDVLPQIRKTGGYTYEREDEAQADRLAEISAAPLAAKVDAVRLSMRLHGKARAAQLWSALGLPTPPPAPGHEGPEEGRRLLSQLMTVPHPDSRTMIGSLIIAALNDDQSAQTDLKSVGIRVQPDEGDHIVIANSHRGLNPIMDGLGYRRGQWMVVLRRLPDTWRGDQFRYGDQSARGTSVPLSLIDEAINREW